MKNKEVLDIQQHIETLKKDSLKRLTNYLMVSLFFLLLILLHRLTDSDWQPIYLVHFLSIAIGGLVTIYHKRLSYKHTIYCYLLLGFITAEVEFLSVGIAGVGDIVSVFCITLSLFYLDKKSTFIVIFIVLVLYAVAAYPFIYSGKALSENDSHYMSWHSSWIGTFIAAAAFFSITSLNIFVLQEKILSLLAKTERQKKIIQDQKEQIEQLANHDSLTGLPSLRVADSRLDNAIQKADKYKHRSALVFLDLDGFKAINDTHGHDAGDLVLKEVAERILSVIRSSDTACRIGGDEFLVIIDKVTKKKDIENLCQRLIEIIRAPVIYQHSEMFVSASIGVAGYPCSASSSKALRLKADELMYNVKRSGKSNYQIAINDDYVGQMSLSS